MSIVDDTANQLVLVFEEKFEKMERDLLLARIKLAKVRELSEDEHIVADKANKSDQRSIDFGRGFAAAIRLVNETLDGHV